MTSSVRDCYDVPGYWDLAFSDETIPEADFLEAVASQFSRRPVTAVLELGCGGGRQTLEMSKRGYAVTAIDLNPSCVKWTKRRLDRHRLSADVQCGDMARFQNFETCRSGALSGQHVSSSDQRTVGSPAFALCCDCTETRRALCSRLSICCHRTLLRSIVNAGRFDRVHTRVTTTIRVLDFSRRTPP